jgi:hypothetical protein
VASWRGFPRSEAFSPRSRPGWATSLVWSEKKDRFKRTGIVAFVEEGERCFPTGLGYFACHTIEAFTPDEGETME